MANSKEEAKKAVTNTVTVNVDPNDDPGVNNLVSDKLPSLND